MKFNKGDIVKIRKNCTLEELDANNSNGCRIGTFKFLENSAYDERITYIVQGVYGDGNQSVIIDGKLVNVCCLELVRRNKNKKFENDKCEIDKEIIEEFSRTCIDYLLEGLKK